MRFRLLLPAAGLAALMPVLPLRSQSSSEPPHGDLAIDCGECHDAERWVPVRGARFRHETTGFRLEGAHAGVGCRSCHRSLVFNRVGTACADCHSDSHRGELGFECGLCHRPVSWNNQREMFAVHSRTRFPLLAVHASLDCDACHRNQQPYQYANTPTECGVCHARTYDATTSPNHAQVGFSRRCEECHSVAARTWQEVPNFQHPASFPLGGAHKGLACSACHAPGIGRVSTQCFTCHEKDYLRTTNPNHVASRFPITCESCHSGAAWRPAKFDHSLSRFPLTGAHQKADCARCHTGGRYTGTPTDCFACHESNYRNATNPSHSGFPTTCESCHSTSAWRPASFDHGRTRFPLTGAHRGLDCTRCHTGGRYAGTPTDCASCHRADYDRASNPNHAASRFPTTCETCHTTAAWRPASFNHDGPYFPIYSGNHRGVWSSCSECHINPSSYRQFECILCHAHSNRAELDREHREVRGYEYSSPACYRCHPRGTAEDD